MKFLADMGISPRTVSYLRQRPQPASLRLWVDLLGLPPAAWDTARADGRYKDVTLKPRRNGYNSAEEVS